MTTLTKRATPSQAQLMRVIVGAAMNAFQAHPNAKLDRRLAKSIAKRTVGTISGQWPEALAAIGRQKVDP